MLKLLNIKNRKLWTDTSYELFQCFYSDIKIRFLYSYGIPLKNVINIRLFENSTFIELEPTYINGDGSIPLKELQNFHKCPKTETDQLIKSESVTEKILKGLNHQEVMNNKLVLNDLQYFLQNL